MGRSNFLKSCRYLPGLAVLLLRWGVFARDDAPPTADRPWLAPGLAAYEQQLTNDSLYKRNQPGPEELDPNKVYDLPELIDIAQRNHPQTRVAWEEARAAAKALGVTKSAYYPYLAASAAAGFQHGPAPILTFVAPASAAEVQSAFLNWGQAVAG